jgi:hypothetical protein
MTSIRYATACFAAVVLLAAASNLTAQQTPPTRATQPPIAGALAGLGSPVNPKVAVAWDRYYDNAGIGEIARRLAAAHPDRIKVGSIGKSTAGKEMWILTVTNFKNGNPDRKPGMWIDGNIHSNEVQGAEFALYTAWYLAEMADVVPAVDSLLNERVLYIVPTINPDGRDHYLHLPNTAHSPRSGVSPRDNDGDGLVDEDGYDDLDGDGNITQMRRRNPNGRWKISSENPMIMVPALPGEPGEYDLFPTEGIDNDGDGLINEDGIVFSYDPNRNWPWRWVPQNVQGGADWYPTSLVETQNIIKFVVDHPNIAGAQSYHNYGGMILRGPGVPQDEYRPQDVQVYDVLGKTGEQILPGYRYMIVWKDLYTVWGGELDWFYGARGILTFSNELFTPYMYFNQKSTGDDPTDRPSDAEARFNKLLLMGEAFVPWKPYNHPQLGPIEIGGYKKNFGRVEPGFMLQMDAHRNMMFTLFQTGQMPLVSVDSLAVRDLGGGLSEVTAIVANRRLAPTHTQQDVENRITRPDLISISGGTVVTGFWVTDPIQRRVVEQKREPARIRVSNIPGMGTATVRWIVQGRGPFTVTADSWKGGVASRTTQ